MLSATDDVVRDGAVSDESWAACKRELGADPALLVELVTAISAWRMVASILHSLQVPLEDGVASWPPDGATAVTECKPLGEERARRRSIRLTRQS